MVCIEGRTVTVVEMFQPILLSFAEMFQPLYFYTATFLLPIRPLTDSSTIDQWKFYGRRNVSIYFTFYCYFREFFIVPDVLIHNYLILYDSFMTNAIAKIFQPTLFTRLQLPRHVDTNHTCMIDTASRKTERERERDRDIVTLQIFDFASIVRQILV